MMRHSLPRLLKTLQALVLFSVASVSANFTDVTDSTGIDYVYAELGDPVQNHAGAGVLDVNGDGWSDIIVSRYGERPFLYVNQKDGTFHEEGVSRGLGVAVDAASFGGGDIDNDGDQDLYVVGHEGDRNWLFINDGTGIFTEEAIARNADLAVSIHEHAGYSIGMVDYDADGYLDIYISEGGVPDSSENALHSALLRNLGEGAAGHFENVTVAAGLLQPGSGGAAQLGFSSAWADFDKDGWQDVALISDHGTSRMFWNNGDGTFNEQTGPSGMGKDEFGMGIAVGDYDLDGWLDLYVTSIFDAFSLDRFDTHTGNKLYRYVGDRKFEESAFEAGVNLTDWGWGTSFFDFDHDGDPDLIATNGSGLATGGNPDTTPFVPSATDPTTLFENDGSGSFTDVTIGSGINDTDLGKALLVLDFDNDGDEDLYIANTLKAPVIYKSDASSGSNKWIRFKFVGETSNRDGYGATVTVEEGDASQIALYNPTNAYIGQRENRLHFGLGAAGDTLDKVTVTWPSGIVQEVFDLATNQLHTLEEPESSNTLPVIVTQPVGGNFEKGSKVSLSVEATGDPAPVFVWEKDGVPIEGESSSTLFIKRFIPYSTGTYRVKVINQNGVVISDEVELEVEFDLESRSVARLWNEFLLEAIRKDFPAPTIHGRNLYHVSAAMWDAFWAYEPEGWSGVGSVYHQEDLSEADWQGDRVASQREAISYAAYRVLLERYKDSVGREESYFGFRWLMGKLGYDPDFVDTVGNSPAAVGNRIGFGVLSATLNDGSNEANAYADTSGYSPSNEPLVFKFGGVEMEEPNLWQPLAFDFLITQNGIPIGADIQDFIGVNWREVDTFAIEKDSSNTIAIDPGPPPLWGTDSEQEFQEAAIEVIRFSSYLDPNVSGPINVSPGARLNNRLGRNDGMGRGVNPVTGSEYEDNWVSHADYGRILAEFWADGPSSETPPGHWNALHNEITEHPLFERKYGGVGEELSELEWDVHAYLALNGGMHDAAVAAWTLKRQYDYVRPISIIRYLASLGQSTDELGPSYHSQGLPLADDLVEVITPDSVMVGERHEHLADYVGEIAIFAWAGEPEDTENDLGGVSWIRAANWRPYQRRTFVTPAFAAYVSGHSTFSRVGAEVMTLLTGSPYFPGGIGEFHFEQNEFLEFEIGPSEDVTLQWATYYDAADQAGISRLYGGIHVRADDFVGRVLGARIGLEAFLKAHSLRNGGTPTSGIRNAYVRSGRVPDSTFARIDYGNEMGSLDTLPVSRVLNFPEIESASPGVYFGLREGIEEDRLSAGVAGALLGTFSAQVAIESDETAKVFFSVEGEVVNPVLVRAVGTSLKTVSEGERLENPKLKLFRILSETEEILVGENNDWIDDDLASLIEVSALYKGIDELEQGSSDACIFGNLQPGRYRLEVLSSNQGEGVVSIEVYAIKNN